MKKIILFLASGFGSGYCPAAPGTAGTVIAAILAWFIPPSPLLYLLITAALIIVSVPISSAAQTILGTKDDPRIVVDEFAGFFAATLFLPHTITFFAGAFVLFRFFDVVKPSIIRGSQSLPGGWGIVADDLLAGIAANTILQAVRLLIP